MKNENKYTITMNETQLKVLNAACEEYFRVRMGQMRDLADDLSSRNCDFSLENKNRDKEFDEFLNRRQAVETVLGAAYSISSGGERFAASNNLDENSKICLDMWHVIRHKLWEDSPHRDNSGWCVYAHEPVPVSELPLPKIRKEEK